MDEVVLSGGNMTPVVRVGDTVRRAAGPWTPTIHALLRHVRAAGFDAVPEPLGIDEKGREILSFVPGRVATYPLDDFLLAEGTMSPSPACCAPTTTRRRASPCRPARCGSGPRTSRPR